MDAIKAHPVEGAMYPAIDANACSICNGITIAKMSSEFGYPHHPNLAKVQESMSGGCKLCALIFDAIVRARSTTNVRQPLHPHMADLLIAMTNSQIRLFWRRDIGFVQHTHSSEPRVENIVVSEQICITWGMAASSHTPCAATPDEQLRNTKNLAKLALYIDRGPGFRNLHSPVHVPGLTILTGGLRGISDSHAAGEYPGRRLPLDLRSQDDQDMLVRWLKTCENRSKDRYIGEGATIPSRVLDVGDSLQSSIVHLRPASSLPSGQLTARYIILSHCWGGKVPAGSTTTSAALQAREAGIELEQLTQNFKDAIQLSRLLGVRYLWIDALCIIQDSPEDWQLESGRMGAYYKNSWLTLAAAMTGDSNGGLLGQRMPPMEPFVELNPQPASVQEGKREVNDEKGRLFFAFDAIEPPDTGFLFGLRGQSSPHLLSKQAIRYEDAFQGDAHLDSKRKHAESWQTALQNRGWTFQEELLSPRWVAFEPSQVYFRCDKFVEFESGRRVEPPDGESCLLGISKGRLTFLNGNWFDLIEAYTARQLTFETDKLAAISGLARELAALTGIGTDRTGQASPDDYCAGLWKSQLLEGLLWGRPAFPTPKEAASFARTDAFVAPSWSWASVNGQVKFYHRPLESDKPKATLLHVVVERAENDPFGQVSAGTLVLHGQCFWGTIPAKELGTVRHGMVFNLDVREHKPRWEAEGVLVLMITAEHGLLLELQEGYILAKDQESKDLKLSVYRRIGKFFGVPEDVYQHVEYFEGGGIVAII